MTTRKLSDLERKRTVGLIGKLRAEIDRVSAGDRYLRFAINRKIFKELTYDERGTPMQRRAQKRQKYTEQGGTCPECGKPLEPGGRNAELDRVEAMDGYTAANTHLIHHDCHRLSQEAKGFRG